MEKRFDDNVKNSSFKDKFQESHLDCYGNYFGTAQLNNRASSNFLGPFDERHKFSNWMFKDDSCYQSIPFEVQNHDYKYDYEPSLFRESKELRDDSFNFQQQFDLSLGARSQQHELNLHLELMSSHRLFSHGVNEEFPNKFESNKAIKQEIHNTKEEWKNRISKETIQQFEIKMASPNLEERDEDASGPKSRLSWDTERLDSLIYYLQKSKGVNKDMIDNEVVTRTIELGQQVVAEQLQIPYRRYKSILNKVGIKTNAGRKVKNLQLEANLVEWALKIKDTNHLLTRKMIRDKASKIIKELVQSGDTSLRKIRLSKGWLDKFVKRHKTINDYITSQKSKKGH